MLADDVRIAMPPESPCLGVQAAAGFFRAILGPDRPGDWLLHSTHANGRPATANYLRRPGDIEYRALSIDVLDIRDGQIVAIRCFLGDRAFWTFHLPGSRHH
jgi:RNA polymerase sigma-70 factor (ECF subfamily)